jgi:hypothetical protein
MGSCDLCGENAGWFQSRHPACEARADSVRETLKQLLLNGTLTGKFQAGLEAEARQIVAENRVPFDHFREAMLQAANNAASQLALQSPVAEEEASRVADILRGFGIDEYSSEWAQRRWFGLPLLIMSHTLWQAFHGIAPFYDGTGRMQFNLRSGETPIFSAGKVTFAEERTVSTQAKGFGGLSIPIGGGVFYNVDLAGGRQGQVSGLLPLDVGEMLITTQALYFGGPKRTLRIPLDHVIRNQFYVDGVGVSESHRVPKVFVPDYRGMDTGWFFFNLFTALTTWHESL